MVEESEERLSEEQIEELIQTVADALPGDPEQENAAPADAEMEEAGDQSWHSDRPEMTRTVGIELDWQWLQNWTGCFYLRHFASLFELNNMLTEGMHNGCLPVPEKDPHHLWNASLNDSNESECIYVYRYSWIQMKHSHAFINTGVWTVSHRCLFCIGPI